MGLDGFDDFEPRPPDKQVQFANAVAVCAGAAVLAMGMWKYRTFEIIDGGIAIAWGITVWGAVRAVLIGGPYLLAWIAGVKITDDKPEDKPVSAPAEVVPPPVVNIDIETEEPLEAWEEALDAKLKDNDRFLVLNGRQWAIPSTVDVEHLFLLAKARANGKLRFMVSANGLDQEAGISRNGKTPNANSLIEFLKNIGAAQDKGERRPMPWTELGTQLFPDKFAETPPPQHVNGQMMPVVS